MCVKSANPTANYALGLSGPYKLILLLGSFGLLGKVPNQALPL